MWGVLIAPMLVRLLVVVIRVLMFRHMFCLIVIVITRIDATSLVIILIRAYES